MSRPPALPGASPADDPFEVLGLPPSPDLSDDDVRAAWRRLAAATHPDRADGGDPAAFAAAATAYTALRTDVARREILAEQALRRRSRGWPPTRPWRLALRVAAAVAVGVVAVAAVGWQPASVAVIAGALTWLTLTVRPDLAR